MARLSNREASHAPRVIYLRVSTIEQTTANQERELREIASRMGCEIVKVYRDLGGLAYGSLPSGLASIHQQCSASAALSTAQASPWRSR
jgi:DNA invertase Pin-like site-specific DNA recombinase